MLDFLIFRFSVLPVALHECPLDAPRSLSTDGHVKFVNAFAFVPALDTARSEWALGCPSRVTKCAPNGANLTTNALPHPYPNPAPNSMCACKGNSIKANELSYALRLRLRQL